jgi:thiamine-monophosphate kinase
MGSEFEFINHIKKKYGLQRIGDDCSVLPKDDQTDLVVTADMLVEDIDFRLDWTKPEFLGHKSLAVSLSDIAAMGGEPKWAMLSVGVPENIWSTDFLDRYYEGWFGLARTYSVELIGGDVSRTPDKIVIDSIAGGEVPKGSAIMRSGAKPGDSIYVSGRLGGAAGGLKLLQGGARDGAGNTDPNSLMVLKQLRPLPRLELGMRLREEVLATAMIDLSDGLSSDLAHLCNASNTGARIYAEQIPFDTGLREVATSVDAMLELALNGGEDFELLFTGNEKRISAAGLTDVFLIGEVRQNPGIVEVVRGGAIELLPARGYRHF